MKGMRHPRTLKLTFLFLYKMAIYQLKVQLKNVSKPTVWRRLLVKDNIFFADLAEIILHAMGWGGFHLWCFSFKPYDPFPSIGIPTTESPFDTTTHDARDVRINEFLHAGNKKMVFTYDFGDDWIHTITLEKVLDDTEPQDTPLCIKAQGCCPPEDCGGPWGYADLKTALEKHGPEAFHEEKDDEEADDDTGTNEEDYELERLRWIGPWWEYERDGQPDLKLVDLDDINSRL